MKIILLSGPPGSGKDTSAQLLQTYLESQHRYLVCIERMSAPLKAALASMLEFELDENGNLPPDMETVKNQTHPILGVSLRQAQTDISKKLLKPLYGQDILARLWINRVEPIQDESRAEFEFVILVPDCGFQVEIDTLAQAFDPKSILLINLHRTGTSYEGDSRERVVAHLGIHHAELDNDTTVEELGSNLGTVVNDTWPSVEDPS